MSRFWKPGTENPRIVEDEEGGVLFYSASQSSSSGFNKFSFLQGLTIFVLFSFSISPWIAGLSGVYWMNKNRYGHASIEKQRQRLPVYKYRTAILYLVETHATTIVVGETGSGKTTQIPQVSSRNYCIRPFCFLNIEHRTITFIVSSFSQL